MTKQGYIRVKVNNISYPAHHIVWFLNTGRLPDKDIDHINGNKSDNRISNLREVSRRDNIKNTPHRSSNKLGVKHVRRLGNGFQVRVDGKSYGVYDSIDRAIEVRDSVESPCKWMAQEKGKRFEIPRFK